MIPGQNAPCRHYWAWESPAGASGAARLCMFCHEPNADWLNTIRAAEVAVDDVRNLASSLQKVDPAEQRTEWDRGYDDALMNLSSRILALIPAAPEPKDVEKSAPTKDSP